MRLPPVDWQPMPAGYRSTAEWAWQEWQEQQHRRPSLERTDQPKPWPPSISLSLNLQKTGAPELIRIDASAFGAQADLSAMRFMSVVHTRVAVS
jgi:hypothetical protein